MAATHIHLVHLDSGTQQEIDPRSCNDRNKPCEHCDLVRARRGARRVGSHLRPHAHFNAVNPDTSRADVPPLGADRPRPARLRPRELEINRAKIVAELMALGPRIPSMREGCQP